MNDSLRMQRFLDEFLRTYEANAAANGEPGHERAAVRVVHAAYTALGRADLEAFTATLADDVVFECLGPPHSAIAGRWQGRDEVVQAVLRNFSKFADQCPELEHVVARGDSVLVVAEETGRYVPTGEAYDVWWLQAFVVKDGKIVRVRQSASGAGPWEAKADAGVHASDAPAR